MTELSERIASAHAYAEAYGCGRIAEGNIRAWCNGEPRVYGGPHADAISAILRGDGVPNIEAAKAHLRIALDTRSRTAVNAALMALEGKL